MLRLGAAVPSEDSLLAIATDPRAGAVERTRAFTDLRAVATERSVSRLVALLGDPIWSFPARSVLETMPGSAAERAILRALESAGPGAIRVGLVNSLGNRRSAAAVPTIAKLLGVSDGVLGGAALHALGQIASAAAADALAAHRPLDAMRGDWADAMLRVAEVFRATDRKKSIELYRLVAANAPAAQAAAAAIGLAENSVQPARDVIGALRSPDPATRAAALAVIRAGRFGPELTAATGDAMPSLPVETQIEVLSVLYDRGDRHARPIARQALAAADVSVQAAAARLLSLVGEPADAAVLLSLIVGDEEPAQSARLALSRIPGEETTDRLMELFRAGGEGRAAAMEVLVARGHRPLLADLLEPGLHAGEEFRRLVANAILVLASGADLARVLALHGRLPAGERTAVESVLRRIAAKHPSRDQVAALLFAAADKLPLEEAAPLLDMLGGVGGDRAFESLSAMLASSDSGKRLAALHALANWRDIRPAGTILAIARADAEPKVRRQAIKSATAMFARSALNEDNTPSLDRVPAAIEGLRATWNLADNAEAKNAIVVALRRLKDARAIAAARELEATQTSPAPAPAP